MQSSNYSKGHIPASELMIKRMFTTQDQDVTIHIGLSEIIKNKILK